MYSIVGEGDFVAWYHDKNGLFSLKSAYRLPLSLKGRKEELGQFSDANNGVRRL